ncbi:glycine--tRNA ligase subunit beta [Pseudothermotoga sp.]|nr:glycine--tRNA ligase subunit beta [Pseudothermotoga sp.]MCX7812321.1 glycine--tRNA ligase subunit beta [Pseudothermotoga sp.]MDW8139391.1 glycine--tRNA ligase subunit beta [Pseudothermotoga sp.]
MMNCVLFEVGVEDLPASEMNSIKDQLKELIPNLFREARIPFDSFDTFVTNRRIAILLKGVANTQEDVTLERRGPSEKVAFSDGQPTKALLGFLSSCGANFEDLFLKDGYVYVRKILKGKDVREILPEVLTRVITSLKFSKPMRWGDGRYEFVRPVKWVLALFNNEIIPLELFDKKSDRFTMSHPYLGKRISINHPNDYVRILKENFVAVDEETRRKMILEQLDQMEKEYLIVCEKDSSLIEEICKITEWPQAIVGKFDEKYLKLPRELITVTVKHHLSAFSTTRDDRLTCHFVAFIDRPKDDSTIITKGYENVVNARLEDARYYFEMDRKRKLEDFNEKLRGIVFQRELGTLYDKVQRILTLTRYLVEKISANSIMSKALRAAYLSKADTATHVVYEFPELQGIMGRVYATLDREDELVALALEDQYSQEPKTELGALIGICDRVDTIVGNIALGNIPTGSKDPYGLRTKADTVYWSIVHFNWDIDLADFLLKAKELLNIGLDEVKLFDFMNARFYAFLLSKNFSFDIARAVNHLWRRPLRGYLSAQALTKARNGEDFNNIAVGFERVHNITKNHLDKHFDGALFEKQAEIDLLNQFVILKTKVEESLTKLDYEDAIKHLSSLKPYIDKYFDEVFVMVDQEDIRRNRLGFLKNIDELFMLVGDLTQLIRKE